MVRDLVGSGGAQSGEDELQYSEADAVSSPFSVRRPGAAHHLTVERGGAIAAADAGKLELREDQRLLERCRQEGESSGSEDIYKNSNLLVG